MSNSPPHDSDELTRKAAIVLAWEERLAKALAMRVIERPKPSIWMIFIPLFLVFFLQHLSKITSGRESFAENYLTFRKLLLEEVVSSISRNEVPDSQAVSQSIEIPADIRPLHEQWAKALSEHYYALLLAEGDDYTKLIHSVYRNRERYLEAAGNLVTEEEDFEKALAVTLEKTVPEARSVVVSVAAHARELLMENANAFFPLTTEVEDV